MQTQIPYAFAEHPRRPKPLSWFLRVFVPTARVEVQQSHFTWTRRTRTITLATVMFLDAQMQRIVGVGEPPATHSFISVQLFPSQPDAYDEYREELLERFLAIGLQRVYNSSFVISPHVHFSNVGVLNAYFRGYQRPIFAAVAIRAGASAVTVDW